MVGLHLPNDALRPGELERIKATGARDLVDLHPFRHRWSALLAAIPGARLHARIEARGDLGDPIREAAEDAALVDAHPGMWSWRRRNEPEIETPGLSPAAWEAWLTSWGRELKRLRPRARVYAPAMSQGMPRFREFLEATVRAALAADLDGIDAHAYGSPAQIAGTIGEHRRRWMGAILVSETNPGAGNAFDPAQWARDLPAIVMAASGHNVEAICLFIWRWATPDMYLPTPVDVAGSPVEAALASAGSPVEAALASAGSPVEAALASANTARPLTSIQEAPAMKIASIGGTQVYDVRDRFPYFGDRSYDERPLSAITMFVQHHLGAPKLAIARTVDEALSQLDITHRWHTGQIEGGHNWPAIGYHFAIDGKGRIYWLHGIQLMSYHARAANAFGVGVVWLGTFDAGAPPVEMVEASRDLKQGLERELGRAIGLAAHYELPTNATTCCGIGHWPRTKLVILRPDVDADALEHRVWGVGWRGKEQLQAAAAHARGMGRAKVAAALAKAGGAAEAAIVADKIEAGVQAA